MTQEPAKQEIEELVRRLETTPYSASDIFEAGQILAESQPSLACYKMALGFADSKSSQVRSLGIAMMEAISSVCEPAKGFLAGVKDAAKLLEAGRLIPPEPVTEGPDYAAIGQVIKMFLQEEREKRKRAPLSILRPPPSRPRR